MLSLSHSYGLGRVSIPTSAFDTRPAGCQQRTTALCAMLGKEQAGSFDSPRLACVRHGWCMTLSLLSH